MSDLAPFGTAGSLTRDLASRVRWLQGRALLERDDSEMREHKRASGVIIPDRRVFNAHAERDISIHRGKVIALGAPGQVDGFGPVVPWDIAVGDVVYYTYGVAMQKLRSFDRDGGGELVVVAQEEIQGVFEP